MVRRSAKERGAEAKTLRIRIAARSEKKPRLFTADNTKEYENHKDKDNDDDEEETDEAATPRSEEERDRHGPDRDAMPMFVRAERPSPRIVLTSSECAVRSLCGDRY